MTTRYCPCCAVAGRNPYTKWIVKGEHEYCESGDAPLHCTGVVYGVYQFSARSIMGVQVVRFSDRVWKRVDRLSDYMERHTLLVKAMEAEAETGIFDPDMWVLTFPRRTVDLMERSRRVAAAALADKLPVVLARIVVAYFMGN